MEKVLSAAQELANALKECQKEKWENQEQSWENLQKAWEVQQDRTASDKAYFDARFKALLHVIEALIETHPDHKVLCDAWKKNASLAAERAEHRLRETPRPEDIFFQRWHEVMDEQIAYWRERMNALQNHQ